MRAKSGREVTQSIYSLPLRTVTDIGVYMLFRVKKTGRYCSCQERKMFREPLFLFETPSAFNSIITRFVITLNLVCPYNNRSHCSLLDRRILSELTDSEIMSKRIVRWDENLGQCGRKCSLSSIPV